MAEKEKKKKKHLQQVKAQQLLVVATEMFVFVMWTLGTELRKGWVPGISMCLHISGVVLAKDAEVQDPPCVCSYRRKLQRAQGG